MKWARSGDTAMRCAPWTVAKVSVKGIFFYELWHDKQAGMLSSFSTFDLAKAEAMKLETAGQG